MATEREWKEWRKYRRQSQRRLRPSVSAAGTITLVLAALVYFSRFPVAIWVQLLWLLFIWYMPVLDFWNVRHQNRLIAEAEREQP